MATEEIRDKVMRLRARALEAKRQAEHVAEDMVSANGNMRPPCSRSCHITAIENFFSRQMGLIPVLINHLECMVREAEDLLGERKPTRLVYKNYVGSVNFDADDLVLYGKIEYIKALVTYEAEDPRGIQEAFEQAVDDYLDTCKEKNIKPEWPYTK